MCAFLFGIVAPKDKYHVLFLVAKRFDNCVGKLLPAFVGVGASLSCTHCKGRVQEENARIRPFC